MQVERRRFGAKGRLHHRSAEVRSAWQHALPSELQNCSQYLISELELLRGVKVALALGRIGFEAKCKVTGPRPLAFGHWARYKVNEKVLLASYHPSRQNTNTGRLTSQMWKQIFRPAKAILKNELA